MTVYAKQIGGLTHWRVGRVGGSFYVAKRNPERSLNALFAIDFAMPALIALGGLAAVLFGI